MTHPMIAWCVIAGVLLCAFLVRAIGRYSAECRHHDCRHRHIVEIGKEREMFFVPGDVDDEDDDFRDL